MIIIYLYTHAHTHTSERPSHGDELTFWVEYTTGGRGLYLHDFVRRRSTRAEGYIAGQRLRLLLLSFMFAACLIIL